MAKRPKTSKFWGALAEYETPAELYHACEKVRDSGFKKWDAYTPFPVHGLDDAMGLKPTPLPWIVLICGLSGAAGGFLLQAWVHTTAYPLVISGKPYFSWQAFIPVTFELGVLFGALGAFFGVLALSRLPRHHHELFYSERFERATNDRFFIAVESDDPKFDTEKTVALLEDSGASHVELVEVP